MNRIILTMDIDWASDEIVSYCFDILRKYDCKATIFATGKSDLLEALTDTRFEVGIHPNFNDTLEFSKKIDELLNIFPYAKGMRSHGLFFSSYIMVMCKEKGILYDSNTILPYHEGLHPVERIPGYFTFPYNWSDGNYMKRNVDFSLEKNRLRLGGLKLFTFHPIHIYMNTYSLKHYSEYKPHYHNLRELEKYRNSGSGIGTYFIQLLEYIKANSIPTYTCIDSLPEKTSGG